jgi:hypothetical protein
MTQPEFARVFDSQGEDYKRAFRVFLDHTDQKRNAKRFLQRVVEDLPARKVFIDAGAGTNSCSSPADHPPTSQTRPGSLCRNIS